MPDGFSTQRQKAGDEVPVFNYAKKEVNLKIVYYGPGLSGKTTNLQAIHDGIKPEFKGKLVSLATQTDRTLFFDFMPLELGSLEGFRVRLHLYTVPGQVHYNATRKLVLKGVDGVVFVADSQKTMSDANMESFINLEKNLHSYGKILHEMPHLIQGNKRDLDDILSMGEIASQLNRYGAPVTEAVASEGEGVLETLTEIVRMVTKGLREQFAVHRGEGISRATVEEVPADEKVETFEETKSETVVFSEAEPESELEPEPDPVSLPEVKLERVSGPGPQLETEGTPETEPEPEIELGKNISAPVPGLNGEPEAMEPVRLTVEVEGVGPVELSITVRARLLVNEEEMAFAVKGEDPGPMGDGGEEHPLEGGVVSAEEEETIIPDDDLLPLGSEPDEPLGAPLDGQEGNRFDMPDDRDGKTFPGEEVMPPPFEPAPSDPVPEYDPAPRPLDILDEGPPGPGEPEPKKKGILDKFLKK